jgi:hypothetical protein
VHFTLQYSFTVLLLRRRAVTYIYVEGTEVLLFARQIMMGRAADDTYFGSASVQRTGCTSFRTPNAGPMPPGRRPHRLIPHGTTRTPSASPVRTSAPARRHPSSWRLRQLGLIVIATRATLDLVLQHLHTTFAT